MSKFKVNIKGNDKRIIIKTKGESSDIISSMMMFVCDSAIYSGVNKKDFIEKCKKTYDICKEMESEEDE